MCTSRHGDCATETLVNFVSKSTRNLFAMLGMLNGFFNTEPDLWNIRDDFNAAVTIIKSLAVTNDHAERGVALIQDAAQSGRFKSEEQLQYDLQVIEQNLKIQNAKLRIQMQRSQRYCRYNNW